MLSATAAQSLLGVTFRITQQRGKLLENTGWALRNDHHSSVLDTACPDERGRQAAYESFVADLKHLPIIK